MRTTVVRIDKAIHEERELGDDDTWVLSNCDECAKVQLEKENAIVWVAYSKGCTRVQDVVRAVCAAQKLREEQFGLFSGQGEEDAPLDEESCLEPSDKDDECLYLKSKDGKWSRLILFGPGIFWKGYVRVGRETPGSLLSKLGMSSQVQLRLVHNGVLLKENSPLCDAETSVFVEALVGPLYGPAAACCAPAVTYVIGSEAVAAGPKAAAMQLLAAVHPDAPQEELSLWQGSHPVTANQVPVAGAHLVARGNPQERQAVMEAAAAAFGSAAGESELLAGEHVVHKIQNVIHWAPHTGQRVIGTLLLTDFRLLFVAHDRSTYGDRLERCVSVPLRLILRSSRIHSSQSSRFLEVTCRNFEAFVFAFPPQKHSRRAVVAHIDRAQGAPPFALLAPVPENPPRRELGWVMEEYVRIFGSTLLQEGDSERVLFRLCHVNAAYELCDSYPRLAVVPSTIKDEEVTKAAEFRSKNRFLSVVWRHSNGATITRCSQPMVGMYKKRCAEDEAIVAAIRASGPEGSPGVVLIDSRPLANAVANKLVGAGSESAACYEGCEMRYIGLGNIHAVRDSWTRLRALCSAKGSATDPGGAGEGWLGMLQGTEWLQHVQHVLEGSLTMARLVDQGRRSCITHCSDGWDRTSQICALAQLMLDPFSRTFSGFARLIHKEWLSFGHKFSTRLGLNANAQERETAPIFLLFLDCVYQMQRQFYSSFEFGSEYLVVLLDASYSGQFGTFLYDSEAERMQNSVFNRCESVWDHLDGRRDELRNPHYKASDEDRPLFPSTHLSHLVLWNRVYLRLSLDAEHEKNKAMMRLLIQ